MLKNLLLKIGLKSKSAKGPFDEEIEKLSERLFREKVGKGSISKESYKRESELLMGVIYGKEKIKKQSPLVYDFDDFATLPKQDPMFINAAFIVVTKQNCNPKFLMQELKIYEK